MPPNKKPRRSGGDPSVRRRKQAVRKESARQSGGVATPTEGPVRLNKFLARAGIASRRDADALITQGRVTVNGQVVTELGTRVDDGDTVAFDGQPVRPAALVYILLNKPTDTITTTSDERGRKTVLDLVDVPPSAAGALFPVGRLDRNTTGALLLTTDGELAHRLMHPKYETDKLYVVRTAEPVQPDQIERLQKGVPLDDGPARADAVGYIDTDRSRVALQIHEGRNRQVRRMFEAIGHEVAALDRVGYAGLTLEGLRRGRWRRLQPHEVNALRRSVKLKQIVF